jgi:LemA protein
VALVFFAIFTAAAFAGFLWASRTRWAAIDTPTIPTGHAFPGRIEVTGRAKSSTGEAMTSPLTGKACVWWQVDVEKKVSSGKKTEWKTFRQITRSYPVLVDDGSGPIAVDLGTRRPSAPRSDVLEQTELPDITGADLARVANDTRPAGLPGAEPSELPGFVRNLVGSIISDHYSDELNLRSAKGDWRVSEYRIEDGDHLYVLGSARPAPSGGLLFTREHGSLMVLLGDEKRFLGRMRWAMVALFAAVLGTSALLFGAAMGERVGNEIDFDGPGALIGVVLAALVVVAMNLVRIRNRIVAAREQVLSSWKLIGIADVKRSELTQNLIATLQAAMAHEREVLTSLARARDASQKAAGAPTADHVQAAAHAHADGVRAVAELRLLREANPSLGSAPNFTHVFDELVRLEDGVAAARAYYVDARTVFADRIGTFPDSLLVRFAGPIPAEFPAAV